MFAKKCICIGVTGGIAAYKSAYLVSAFAKSGADVHVLMTKNACEFVAPLTFQTLSSNEVLTDMFSEISDYNVAHVALAKKADMFIVAPATANFIAKAANGFSDDILSTVFLAAKCPKVIAPAMNTQMYNDITVKQNIAKLKNNGCFIMDTGKGTLACGDIGEGRMKEPEEIISFCKKAFEAAYDMAGINVLVTAGPTREYIDPVRYISSPSTGKMGYSIAEEALSRGALVTLISGPGSLKPPAKALLVRVTSAREMYEECISRFDSADIVLKTAAVADYRPKEVHVHKVKKGQQGITLELERTHDILFELGQRKKNQVLVGFAAETNNLETYARDKLQNKNADMICANDISKQGSGFGSDNNHLIIYAKNKSKPLDLGMLSKKECAKAVLNLSLDFFKKNKE